MYPFAIVLLVGLVVAKVIHLVAERDEVKPPIRTLGMLVVGVVVAYLGDLNLFKMWDVPIRSGLGVPVTGLVFGAMAGLWHEILGLLSGIGRKTVDEAIELETHRRARAA